MQIKMALRPNGTLEIPFNYNYQLQSVIYRKLEEVNFSEFVHFGGFASSHFYKAFVFGALEGKHTPEDGLFHFTDDISFEIRSPIFEFCDMFQRSIELRPQIRLFNTDIEIVNVALCNKHFAGGTVTFSANSPVTVFRTEPDRKKTFFSPDSEEFIKYVMMNYCNKYAAIVGGEADNIEVKTILPQRKIVTKYKNTWINAYKGRYTITGTSKALEFIYNTGLGAKNSQGFGMLDAADGR